MSKNAYLIRLNDSDPEQSLGYFTLWDGVIKLLEARSLELPYRDNQRGISSIPPDTYTVVRRSSKRYGSHYHVKDVQGRTLILIHAGNFHRDTRGCILLGEAFTDLDRDNHLDITASRATMDKLLTLAGDQFNLTIYEDCIDINTPLPGVAPGKLQST